MTAHIMMVEPAQFGFNEVAAASNSFQNIPEGSSSETMVKALEEFQTAVKQLETAGVDVMVFKDSPEPVTPDAIFPNNWISTHADGNLLLYPMAVSNRRAERRSDIVEKLRQRFSYRVTDLSDFENASPSQYLEGTGSLIFDHEANIVYAAISPRTDEALVEHVAQLLGYTPICFTSYGKSGELIYHTNVMMCVGTTFVIVGDQTIAAEDRDRVLGTIRQSGKELVLLSNEQIYNHFAGNMLQISNASGERILVMSTTARKALRPDQLSALEQHNDHLIAFEIPTIEYVGGGSARCMLAEIYPVTGEN